MTDSVGQSENKSKSTTGCSKIRDQSKLLIFCTFAIGFISLVLNYYLSINEEEPSGIKFKFEEDVDRKLIEELHRFIINEFDTPTYKWSKEKCFV